MVTTFFSCGFPYGDCDAFTYGVRDFLTCEVRDVFPAPHAGIDGKWVLHMERFRADS